MQPLQHKTSCASLNNGEQQQSEMRNNTYQSYPKDLLVHELVSRRAETVPDTVAITCESTVMSYGELECRSNRLAQHLRALGVGPGVLVGVCVERSPMMVLGALAVLKAEGCLCPSGHVLPLGAHRFHFG